MSGNGYDNLDCPGREVWRIITFFLVISLTSSCGLAGGNEPSAVRGIMDLRRWDFQHEGAVELTGQWEFYWGQLLEKGDFGIGGRAAMTGYSPVPGIWNGAMGRRGFAGRGCATYRLRILMDAQKFLSGDSGLALKLQDMGTAYKLILNGRKIASGGAVSSSPEKTIPAYNPCIAVFDFEGSTLEVVLQVSNYHHHYGGAWGKIYLGRRDDISGARERRIALAMFLFGSIFIISLYHIILFIFRRRDLFHLYFSFFSLLIAMRILATGEYYIINIITAIPWDCILMIEYITFYAAVPLFFLFMHSLLGDDFSPIILRIILALGLVFTVLVLLTPSYYYTHTMQIYQGISLIICIYGLFVLLRMVTRSREGAIPFLLGYIVLFISVINDFLYNNLLVGTGYSVPFGLFMFIFSQAFILSTRFSSAFAEVEIISEKLDEKNRQLMRLDRLKDEYLAVSSHELRTPLNGIVGIAESLFEKASADGDTDISKDLSLIVACGRRLSNLVRDVLDITRLKNNDITLNLKEVDISAVAAVAVELSSKMAEKKGVSVINAIGEEIPPVMADEDRVEQILMNLIENGVKFTDAGTVTVSARKIGPGPVDEMVEVFVSDTGVGIPAARQDSIITAIQDDDAHPYSHGSGIGLSIVGELVRLHGGTLSVLSDYGIGTMFSFTLPVLIPDGSADNTSASNGQLLIADSGYIEASYDFNEDSIEGRSLGDILIIDDDEINLMVMKKFLSAGNYNVVPMISGSRALESLKERSYDCVLLDLMMPGMSGYEVCVKLRQRYDLHELPVIILTVRNSTEELVSGFMAGANDYLIKPLKREELLVRVKTLVTLKRSVQEHKAANVKLLQERMSPHFLFNALNTIHSIISRDVMKADDAVIQLADIYHFILDRSFEALISFDEEWDFVSNYCSFEELRFHNTLNISMEKRGDFNGIMIPPLTLQPIVENSLKHGLKDIAGKKMMTILAEVDGRSVTIAVRDNGAGLKNNDYMSRSLGNIVKRLQHHFVEVDLKIHNRREGGVEVLLAFHLSEAM